MIPRMSEKELRQFVLDFCDGRIFTSLDVRDESLVLLVFMPLTFTTIPEEDVEQLGLVWEYISKAGTRGINGMPMFYSCRLMHRDDLEAARPLVKAEVARREAYLNP